MPQCQYTHTASFNSFEHSSIECIQKLIKSSTSMRSEDSLYLSSIHALTPVIVLYLQYLIDVSPTTLTHKFHEEGIDNTANNKADSDEVNLEKNPTCIIDILQMYCKLTF